MHCPEEYVMTGLECKKSNWYCPWCDRYCDNKRLRCRKILPERLGLAAYGVMSRAGLMDLFGDSGVFGHILGWRFLTSRSVCGSHLFLHFPVPKVSISK